MRYLMPLAITTLFLFIVNTVSAQKTLAIIGSSTSACTGPTDPNNCYVIRLRNYYNVSLPNDTIINKDYAVPGYTVFRGMPTGYVPNSSDLQYQPDPGHNITSALALNPNVVLVNYPTNGYDVIRLDSILLCLRIIKNTANLAGVPCYITTTQPRTSGGFGNSVVKAKLAELKDSILLEFGYYAIDFYTDLINPADSSIRYDAGDGTHMNDIGHDSLFKRVAARNVFLTALPVTFLQFNTVYKNNADVITWLVAKETDVAGYEIQRSDDGIAFSKIGVVNAGNNPGNTQYQYTDDQPLKGWNYYKIIIIDKDGKKHASPVMKVNINTSKLSLIKAYTSSSTQLIIELQNKDVQTARVQLFNNLGMLVTTASKKIEAGSTTLYLNTPALSNGVYHVKISAGNESVVGSFIH